MSNTVVEERSGLDQQAERVLRGRRLRITKGVRVSIVGWNPNVLNLLVETDEVIHRVLVPHLCPKRGHVFMVVDNTPFLLQFTVHTLASQAISLQSRGIPSPT